MSESRSTQQLAGDQAKNVERRILAIEHIGQRGRIPGYWRQPLALAMAADEVGAADLNAAYKRAVEALKDVLDVAEREIAGFPIDREEWYARRDYARIQVEDFNA